MSRCRNENPSLSGPPENFTGGSLSRIEQTCYLRLPQPVIAKCHYGMACGYILLLSRHSRFYISNFVQISLRNQEILPKEHTGVPN